MDYFEFLLFFAEFAPVIVALNIGLVFLVRRSLRLPCLLLIPGLVVWMIGGVLIGSHFGDDFSAGHSYDPSLPSLRVAVERYIETGEGDADEIIESGRYKPSFGLFEIRYLLTDLIRHTFLHTNSHNEDNIDEGYNKGNAWFEATLGEPMVYTSGIYKKGDETLAEAQVKEM